MALVEYDFQNQQRQAAVLSRGDSEIMSSISRALRTFRLAVGAEPIQLHFVTDELKAEAFGHILLQQLDLIVLKLDDSPAGITNTVVVVLGDVLVESLAIGKVAFLDQAGLAQQAHRTIDGRESDSGGHLFYMAVDIIRAQMTAGVEKPGGDIVALPRRLEASATHEAAKLIELLLRNTPLYRTFMRHCSAHRSYRHRPSRCARCFGPHRPPHRHPTEAAAGSPAPNISR